MRATVDVLGVRAKRLHSEVSTREDDLAGRINGSDRRSVGLRACEHCFGEMGFGVQLEDEDPMRAHGHAEQGRDGSGIRQVRWLEADLCVRVHDAE